MSGGIISSMMLLQTNLLPPKRNNLGAYTWEEISRIRKAGKAKEYFEIGDSKPYSLSNNIKTRIYDAVILDITKDYIVFATFPKTREKFDDSLFSFQLHNDAKEKIDYTMSNFFNKINTNLGLHIIENEKDLLSKYCLNIETSYVKVLDNGFETKTGYDIKGPLYLPSFTDYNGTVNNIDKTYINIYDGYDPNVFVSKNYLYNDNTKIYELVSKLQYGGSAILLTRDIVGTFKYGSNQYATILPNFEARNKNNPVGWYNRDTTRASKVQPFFYI